MKPTSVISDQIERDIALDPMGTSFGWAQRFGAAIGHLRQAERELAQYKAPAPTQGELETTWPGEFATYVVHFDHFDDEDVEINGIFLRGMDVKEELNGDVLASIEEHCLQVVENNRRESQMQAGEDIAAARHEERWAA
tara:strand:+ start:854 stop:1270 length:417 start_codon:yes stop_codon:yes gene_type:complete